MQKSILITGGAGFIGSHVVRHFVHKYPGYRIINLDKLTYAGNLANLSDLEGAPNYCFEKADIADETAIQELFSRHQVDAVLHLAAESHVDRSITNPLDFIQTNVVGTANMLNAARKYWASGTHLFYQISTDEVYGSLGSEGKFTESTPYDPRSPYSASKASADHFVRAYGHTYGLPVVLSNCSNNYGPYQFPEKLIPLMINNIIQEKPLPVYGDGSNVRDWLWVGDHVRAIDLIFHKGKAGETYNIGGDNELTNLQLLHILCDIMDHKLGKTPGTAKKLITFIKDRPGHDKRYAIDASKLKNELGWKPETSFEKGMEMTVDWYLQNPGWLENIISGEYLNYYQQQYHGS